LETHGLQN
jgi:chromosome segregation ATPase